LHIVDEGHFALDVAAAEIAALVRGFTVFLVEMIFGRPAA
jgi:hypothetical protein